MKKTVLLLFIACVLMSTEAMAQSGKKYSFCELAGFQAIIAWDWKLLGKDKKELETTMHEAIDSGKNITDKKQMKDLIMPEVNALFGNGANAKFSKEEFEKKIVDMCVSKGLTQ